MRFSLPFLIIFLSSEGFGEAQTRNEPMLARQSCLDSARNVIGAEAEILRLGRLSRGAPEECVATVRSKKFASDKHAISITRLVILRTEGGRWLSVFEAGKQLKNPEGYVGLDYIDDGWDFQGYRLEIGDRGSDGMARFTMLFWCLNRDGTVEGLETEIA